MTTDTEAFYAVKTVKGWNDSIGTSTRSLFQCLSQALITLRKSDWGELLKGLADGISTDAEKKDAPERTWATIWLSLAEAMFELTGELALWLSWSSPEDSEKIVQGLDYSFEDENLALESSVYTEPDKLDLLEWIKIPFEKWLIGQGLEVGRAQPALERLNVYYKVVFFRNLLKTNKTFALPEPPSVPGNAPGNLMDLHWAAYLAELEKQTRRPYLAEDTFDTSQVYIPLRAYHQRPVLEGDDFKELDDYLRRKHKGRVKEVVDLETALTDWIHNPGHPEKLCLIATTPGAGEGTFNRNLAHKIAHGNRIRPLLISFDDWDGSADPESEWERFLVGSGRFPQNPIDRSDDDFILIFEKLGKLTGEMYDLADRVSQFLLLVNRLIEDYNRNGRRLIVIVSGFAAIMRIVGEKFRVAPRIYHILPFVVSDEFQSECHDPRQLLPEDQRDEWWRRYGQATGREYRGIPEELGGLGGNFRKLTANPAFNYMAACCWEKKRLALSDNTTRGDLAFERLMLTYDNVYNPQKPYHWLFEITPTRYRSVLKEIAVMAWHHAERAVPMNRMTERFERSGLASQLEAISELAQAGALSFLNYESGTDNKGGLSFPYRGLPNYLVARRIFNEFQVIEHEFEQRSAFAFKGLDDEAALRRWVALCGPARFNHQKMNYFIDIIQVEAAESAEAWQEMTVRLFNWIARYGLPLGDLGGSSNQMMAWARNAEETLLVCHYACARVTMKKSRIAWPRRIAAGEWIRRLTGQEMEGVAHLVFECLSYLDFSDYILDGIYLKGGNLSHSSFRNSSLNFACLAGADLNSADLTGASLHDANLSDADLRRTYMRQTDISQSNLKRADLRQADLSRSSLVEAELRGADLRWTDLREADLRKADLRGCDLRWAYLEGVDLRGSDLRGADLRETDLSQAKLEGTDLTWADLDHSMSRVSP